MFGNSQASSDPAFRNWLVVVQSRVAQGASRARKIAPAGRVRMRFTVFRDGSVGEVELSEATSARIAALGVQAVRTAYPFPPIPEFTGRESFRFSVVINYTGRSTRRPAHRA